MIGSERDPPHYLRPLTSATIPRRLLWLHCESRSRPELGAMVERWGGAALGETWWTSKRDERRDTLTYHPAPAPLWAQVHEFCRPGKRAVLWAHDLAFQLRVSRALVELPRLGWRLDRIVLERTASWALFRHGKRTLLCCDLKSWAPAELSKLHADLAATGHAAQAAESFARGELHGAELRALIIREAVLQILEWLSAESLGPFRPTGSGQSYAAYRRRFLTHKLLVHDDLERLELERVAMWTGRCEAWRHGPQEAGPYVEYDMSAAYCRIAAECEVPAIAGVPVKRPSLPRLAAMIDKGAVMAEVEVWTEQPIVPARLGERTVWPAGHFRTVLWDPELRLVLEHAQRVRIVRAWPYSTAPALQDFARFALEGMGPQTQVYGLVPARVLKHWSRCLVGRLGLRYRQWQRFGTCSEPDLRLVTYIDVDEGTATDMLCAGHERLILAGLSEALDSLPQIPGWVMSECRRRLWSAMTAAGLERVLYVDTDSIILDASGLPLGRSPLTNGAAGHWAVKAHYQRLTIHGPRNLAFHAGRRVAGLPLSARQVAPLEFTGQVMRSIKESMRAGELDHVASIPRKFVLDAPDLRREHLPNGLTAPYRLERPQDE